MIRIPFAPNIMKSVNEKEEGTSPFSFLYIGIMTPESYLRTGIYKCSAEGK